MSDPQKQSGHYTLDSFIVRSFDGKKQRDLKLIIHTFNIYESMSTGSIRGSAVVYDTSDMIATFPLRCEEFIDITYSDFFDTVRTESMFLYSISDVKYGKESSQAITQYTLNFVSVAKVFSEDLLIQKTYKPDTTGSVISDYVQTVFDEYYVKPLTEYNLKAKDIIIEPTTGPQSYVIPKFTPEETMQFFSRRAYSTVSITQTFRFFESREKYYFATNEYMELVSKNMIGYDGIDPKLASAAGIESKTIPIFRINYMPDKSPDRQRAAMYELLSIDFGLRANLIEDLNKGGYKRASYEVDVMNGTIVKVPYDHITTFNEEGQRLNHIPEFVDSRMTKETERYIFKDYASTGGTVGPYVRSDQNYTELHNVKSTNFYHYNKNKIVAKIYGRNEIFAGSIIDLELIQHTSATDKLNMDKEKSGRYLVESVDNVFYENTYTQNLTLSKNGIGT